MYVVKAGSSIKQHHARHPSPINDEQRNVLGSVEVCAHGSA
ncbi:unnamed protein product [Ectocarpus sp. 6 AP-2014]